jgi:isopenicillin N synthase-like dioxygenase
MRGDGVPVVDISADPAKTGAELDEICRTTGFFQVTGHGIDDGVAEAAWTMATRFFDLPLEDKLAVARPTPDGPAGPSGARVRRSRRGLVLLAEPVARRAPGLRPAWAAYYDAMRGLGNRLMSLFAWGLGLPPGFFAGKTGHGPNALRAVNYPGQEHAPRPGQLRAGPHLMGKFRRSVGA